MVIHINYINKTYSENYTSAKNIVKLVYDKLKVYKNNSYRIYASTLRNRETRIY